MRPGTPVVVPDVVGALAAGRTVRCVWRNGAGGLTFRLGDGADREFVKWQPHDVPAGERAPDVRAEARRLRWAAAYTAVPRVLGTGGDAEAGWLHTAGLPGESPVGPDWRGDPRAAARAVGRALRALHDALPVERCPFDWGTATRIRALAASTGRDEGVVRAHVGPPPPVDRLVVCHGDACVPNTLLAPDGTVTGHVDLGSLGVADRWADLAVASWSTVWNYGPGLEVPLLAAYGVEPDPVRIAWYRTLWGDSPTTTA